jgi:hypothetical protein
VCRQELFIPKLCTGLFTGLFGIFIGKIRLNRLVIHGATIIIKEKLKIKRKQGI